MRDECSSEAGTYLDIEVVLLRSCLLFRQQLESLTHTGIEHLANVLTETVSIDLMSYGEALRFKQDLSVCDASCLI